jgi:hypothetical protein
LAFEQRFGVFLQFAAAFSQSSGDAPASGMGLWTQPPPYDRFAARHLRQIVVYVGLTRCSASVFGGSSAHLLESLTLQSGARAALKNFVAHPLWRLCKLAAFVALHSPSGLLLSRPSFMGTYKSFTDAPPSRQTSAEYLVEEADLHLRAQKFDRRQDFLYCTTHIRFCR